MQLVFVSCVTFFAVLCYFSLESNSEGHFYIQNRIYQGHTVWIKQFPFLAHIEIVHEKGHRTICSGSLISHKYVLTAAHCVRSGIKSVTVRLGIDSIIYADGIKVSCSQCWKIPAGYEYPDDLPDKENFTSADYYLPDIALIELPTYIYFTDKIWPVRLPTYHDLRKNLLGHKGKVIGWGQIPSENMTSETFPLNPMATDVRIMDPVTCFWLFKASKEPYDPNNQFCTLHLKQGTCHGDSGGPLIVKGRIVGVVSGGTDTDPVSGDKHIMCAPNYGDSYTNVTSFLKWIDDNSDVDIGERHNSFNKIWPVRLPTFCDLRNNLLGHKGKVIGWGQIPSENMTSETFPLNPMATDVRIMDPVTCFWLFKASKEPYDPNNQFCTLHLKQGTCHGDSGGPLIVKGKIVGVVSGGTDSDPVSGDKHIMCAPNYGDSYTNVTSFLKWIDDNSDVDIGERHNSFNKIWPVRLPTYHDLRKNLLGHKGKVIGWGQIPSENMTSETFPLNPMATDVRIMDPVTCFWLFKASKEPYDPNNQFCTLHLKQGTCHGDSWGPLIVKGRIVGVVSGGTDTDPVSGDKHIMCAPNYGDSYTNVTSFLKWIDDNSDVDIGERHNSFS